MKNKILKVMSAVMAVVILTFSCMIGAVADTVGSITVTVKYGDTIVTDGVLTIYKVADYSKNFTDEFSGCGLDLSDLESSSLGWLLWNWTINTGVNGTSIAVGSDGTVTFSGLETGIYLIVPSTNPTGYDIEPSVVPVPLDGEYDVEVVTKIEPTTTPDTPDYPTPTTTTTVTEPDEEVTVPEDEEPSDTDEEVDIDDEPDVEEETLPQTGQLNYPIPIMAGAGGVCVAAGLILTKTDKKR
ncbi:MAG: hypothetical protein LUH23_03760 [Oscillospiraceae bacterium]|nr:hypothetical protein [Oscillospiraceae bacterium]